MSKFYKKLYLSFNYITKNGTILGKYIYIDRPKQVLIGEKGFVNHHVQFVVGGNNTATIKIGNKVWIAPNVCFYCTSHLKGTHDQRAGDDIYKSIEVGDGTWIGANAIILQGVSIGKGCIIGAGSVVNRDVPDDEFWGGSPARFIKKLD